jgi:hypothetical protein
MFDGSRGLSSKGIGRLWIWICQHRIDHGLDPFRVFEELVRVEPEQLVPDERLLVDALLGHLEPCVDDVFR